MANEKNEAETLAKFRYRPLFLVKPKTMSERSMRRAEKLCGIVIVECEQPEAVRLLEPPFDAGLDSQARASLDLARMVIRHDAGLSQTFTRAALIEFFTLSLIAERKPEGVKKVR